MRIIFIATITTILTSCGPGIDREKIPGLYVWNDLRLDTLEIRSDGTYEYWAFLPGQKLKNQGTWQLNSNQVEFEKENFPFIRNHVPGASWYSTLRQQDGEIQLVYEADTPHDLYLRKIKSNK